MFAHQCKKMAFNSFVVVLLIGIPATVWGQGTGGQVPDGNAGGQGANANATDSNVSLGDGRSDIAENSNVDIEISDDTRNQGFIGASAPVIQDHGFIGASSEQSGPPLAPEATFGGGVNTTVTSQAINGGGGGGRGGQGGFGAAAGNGVNITRRSRNVRARMRPSFSAPRVSTQQAVARFGDHFSRQPGSASVLGKYVVTITNRTAVISGNVNTRKDADRLVRQLRLEPGVYEIVNRLRVLN